MSVLQINEPGRTRGHGAALRTATPAVILVTLAAMLLGASGAAASVRHAAHGGSSLTSVVATPAPGSQITPSTDITLTFSRPVSQVLGSSRPPVNPITPGVWHNVNARTIVFRPLGYGYGLGASVQVLLPGNVRLVGATGPQPGTGAYPVAGNWSVPQASTYALQQLLAQLGYLPVTFTPAGVRHKPTKPVTTTHRKRPPRTGTTTTGATTTTTTGATTTTTGATTTTTGTQSTTTPATGASAARASARGIARSVAAEEAAIANPVKGTFRWRYPHTPALLKHLWSPTKWTEVTKGAVMAFEENVGLTPDGIPGPAVWKALINAAVAGKGTNFGYTFVMVSEHLPETVTVWHNGKVVVHGLANTGIAVSPTEIGTFAVYEHLRVTTMSGTNPNGTHYHDTGIPWTSYFYGGDALHGFIRASYGYPQSLGCVEMPFAEAGQVWPYTPIGTLVNVSVS